MNKAIHMTKVPVDVMTRPVKINHVGTLIKEIAT